jgi:hypothetical protein
MKTTQAEALEAVIQREIEQPEKEVAAEQDKASLNAINEPLAKRFHYNSQLPRVTNGWVSYWPSLRHQSEG